MLSTVKSMPFRKRGSLENVQPITRNNSITTPALLFYQPQHSQFSCLNHPSHAAHYYSLTRDEDQEAIYYCEKCAGLLFNQGFQIFSVKSMKSSGGSRSTIGGSRRSSIDTYPHPERSKEIEALMEELRGKLDLLNQSSGQIKDILVSSQEFYGQQIEEINEYFQTIAQTLELQKNKCYNHILHERQNAEIEARATLKKLTEGEEEIQAMLSDIQDNVQSVFSISWENYSVVIHSFEDRLRSVEQLIQELQDQGIRDVQFRKVQFAGVPDSINTLSQLVMTKNSQEYISERQPLADCQEFLIQKQNLQDPDQSLKNPQPGQMIDQQQLNSLMFSFDGDVMQKQSSCIAQPNKNCDFLRRAPDENDDEEELLPNNIKLKSCKTLFEGLNVERVEGIPEVQEVDVLVMPDECIQ